LTRRPLSLQFARLFTELTRPGDSELSDRYGLQVKLPLVTTSQT